jgi:hypothetical protein
LTDALDQAERQFCVSVEAWWTETAAFLCNRSVRVKGASTRHEWGAGTVAKPHAATIGGRSDSS